MDGQTNGQKMDKRTDKRTNVSKFHQFLKEPSYDGYLCPCQVGIRLDKPLESGNKNVDKQMDGQTRTISKGTLAMMFIYFPVKFEFDWTNRFQVRVRNRKMWTDGQTDGRQTPQSNRWVGYTQPA